MSEQDWLLNLIVRAHDQASSVMKGFGANAVAVGEMARTAFLGIGAGAAIAVGESLKLAEGFDREMRKVAALADASTEHLDDMKTSVLNLSTIVPKSAEDLARAFYFIESSGLRGKDAMTVLEASAKAAVAGLTDTKTVADAVTSVLAAYGLGADQAGNITGKLTAAVTAGKVEYADLASSIGMVLPMASAAGVSFDQVAASMATMTRIGLNAHESATAVKTAIQALEAPTKMTKNAIAEMGLTTDQVRSMLASNYLGTLQMMMEKTHGNVDALHQLFPNVRALTGVLATAGSQGKAYADNLDAISKAGAAANENAFGITMQGAGPQLELVKNQLAAMAIELGENLLPYLIDFAKWAREALKVIEGWVKQNPELAKFAAIAVGVAAGLSAVSVVVGPLIAIVGGLVAIVGGPLLLAIVAVIAIGALLITHWQDIKASAVALWGIVSALFQKGVAAVGQLFSEFGSKVRGVLDTIGATVGGFFDRIGTTIRGFFDDWGKIWATFSEKPIFWITYFVTTAVRNFLEFVNSVLKVLGDFFTALPGNVGTWLGHVFDAIGTFVRNALDAFGKWTTDTGTTTADFFSTLPDRLGAWLSDTLTSIGTFVVNAWQAFVDWRDKVKTTIWDFFLALPGAMFDFGKQLVQGLIGGIGSMFSALGSAVRNIADQVTGGFKAALGIHSPSTVFAEMGRNLMYGLAAGISDTAQLPNLALAGVNGSVSVGTRGSLGSSAEAATHPVYVYVNGAMASGADVKQLGLDEFLNMIRVSNRT